MASRMQPGTNRELHSHCNIKRQTGVKVKCVMAHEGKGGHKRGDTKGISGLERNGRCYRISPWAVAAQNLWQTIAHLNITCAQTDANKVRNKC